MKLRTPFGWMIAAGLMAGQSAFAQNWGPSPVPSASPAGWEQQLPPGPEAYLPYSPCPPDQAFDYAELLPDDRGWCFDTDSRCCLDLRETLKGTWVRLEYLLVKTEHRNATTLGEPLAGVPNVAEQFDVTYTDGLTTALAQVPTTEGINWQNMNGIRGSIGVPLNVGWVEASVMALARGHDSLKVQDIPLTGGTLGPGGTTLDTFLATTLTTDGLPGDRVILYDDGFFSEYTSDLFSWDLNFVYNFRVPDEGWNVQPIVGYRHDQYSENLQFGGTFSNVSGYYSTVGVLANPVSNRIGSTANNYRNMVQFGLRNEFVHRWFTVGVQPMIAFGGNAARIRVVTDNVRDPGDPAVVLDPTNAVDDPVHAVSYTSDNGFAATFDLKMYGTVNLTDWMKFRIGWDLMWLGQLAAADRGIRFNEVTNSTPPPLTTADVVSQHRQADRIINAFTIGGEILLP